MSLLLVVEARHLAHNEAATAVVLYRGPHETKVYTLRLSDTGIAPILHKTSGLSAGVVQRAVDQAAATIEARRDGTARLIPASGRAVRHGLHLDAALLAEQESGIAVPAWLAQAAGGITDANGGSRNQSRSGRD